MSIIGIDIGSVSIAAVAVETDGTISAMDYRFHQGEIERSLSEAVRHLEELLDAEILTDEYGPVFGAYGAALAYRKGRAK